MNNLVTTLKNAGITVLPDSGRYKCRFDIPSQSSNRLYRVSFDNAPGAGYWTCSCPGNIRYGQCKHLTAIGLKGRKFGNHQRLEDYISKTAIGA